MGRSLKSKKVYWASDRNLCQTRLFSSEESPSQVALGTQDRLKGTRKWPIHNEADNSLPPGFEGIHPTNLRRVKLPLMPLIKWTCPLRFEVNTEWQVVSGEESKEVKVQIQREMRVFKAVYSHPSHIPLNPIECLDANTWIADDKNTPVVPIKPIEEEEEEAVLDTSFNSPAINPKQMISPPQISTQPNGASKAVAKDDILTVIGPLLSKCDMEKLIDHDLLVQFLSDPKLLYDVIRNHDLSSPNVHNGTSVEVKKVNNLPYNPAIRPQPTNNIANRVEHCCISSAMVTTSGPLYPTPANGHVKMDVNYYKNLVQEHGNEKEKCPAGQEQKCFDVGKSRQVKQKLKKPCFYFNTPKGCRNGDSCTFQHSLSTRKATDGFKEVFSAKRVKLC